jgi:hypothetical protein
MKRILLTLAAAGVATVGVRRWLAPAPPSLGTSPEPTAGPLPLQDELALVEDAAPEASAEEQDTMEVDIVDVVDDLLEPETPETKL